MTFSSLTDEGSYRAAQEQEEAKLAYIMDILDRMRYRQSTDEDIAFLERELTPNLTQPRTRPCLKFTK